MLRLTGIAAVVLIVAGNFCAAQETNTKILWQGTLHLGDSPEKYPTTPSGGMTLQVPCALDASKKGRLSLVTRDVQTLAGEGHYLELLAHYEDSDGPAREYVVEVYRIKEDTPETDIVKTFPFDPMQGLNEARPAYYSVRVRIDSSIKFTLWDDFIVKKIEVEQ